MKIGEDQARAMVRARLGREPADFLESAVVLEAWGGLRASTALDVAPSWQPGPAVSSEFVAPREDAQQPRGTGWVVVSTVLGTAVQLLVLDRYLPRFLVDEAWHAALPLALAGQWVLRRRYGGGTRRLDGDRNLLGVVALVALVIAALSGSTATLLAALILLPWCAAALVVGTPLAARYAGALGAGAGLTLVMPTALLAALTPGVVAVLVSLHALRHPPGDRALAPSPWRTALPVAVPGFALGLLILAAPAHAGSIGSQAVIAALLPSLLGNHAAGIRLRRLWDGGVSPASVVVQALTVLALVTIVGSLALLGVAHATSGTDLGDLSTTLTFLLVVAVLMFPLMLLDAFRFDSALVTIGAVTWVIMTVGDGKAPALLAAVVATSVSAVIVGQLLRDGIRLRALPS